MRVLFWILGTVFFAVLLGSIIILMLKYLNPAWWQRSVVKKMARGWLLFGLVAVGLWILGYSIDVPWLGKTGSTLAVIMLTVSFGQIVILPISAIINKLANSGATRSNKDSINYNRRLILKSTAVALPFMSIGAAGTGLAAAHNDTRMDIVPLEFEGLPDELNGFKILHLTDSHLGIYKHLDDLESIIEQASAHKPDLLLYSGDIADDLTILPDALKIVASLKTPYGIYASLGNHEYYRGVNEVRKAFEKSEVRLLVSEGLNLDVEGANLYLVGVDDPRFMGKDNYKFLEKSILKAMDKAPADAFITAMSHRPNGFDPATDHGINLTLAGHTHGGQIGWGEKSIFSLFTPDSYLRGHYQKEKAKMYVSSGIGHWFPFRLNCPSEAPIITLISKN